MKLDRNEINKKKESYFWIFLLKSKMPKARNPKAKRTVIGMLTQTGTPVFTVVRLMRSKNLMGSNKLAPVYAICFAKEQTQKIGFP